MGIVIENDLLRGNSVLMEKVEVVKTEDERKFVTKAITNMFKTQDEKFNRKMLDFGMNYK